MKDHALFAPALHFIHQSLDLLPTDAENLHGHL